MSDVAFPAIASAVYPPPPPVDWLTGPGRALLTIAGQALDGATIADRPLGPDFPRRAVVHGPPKPLPVDKGPGGQLYVSLTVLHPGRAGQEQFQWPDGSYGTLAFRATIWSVQLWARYTMPYKDTRAATPDESGDAEERLLTALGAVWAALQATAQGGWTAAGLNGNGPRSQQILIGRANPLGPAGVLAGYDIPVTVQV